MQNPALAQTLAQFQIDEGQPALTFAARLARENRWSPDFARRVVAEYFRFLYLAAISPRPVTPSNEIDQAWHLHLCYTRSYWHDLCRDTLERELHHGPTKGGRAENEKYTDWYAYTLDLYQREFGHAAPADVWPSSAQRFSPKAIPVSVAPKRFWIIEKRLFKITGRVLALTGAAATCVGALASTSSSSGNARTLVLIIAIFVLACLLVCFFLPKKPRDQTKSKKTEGGSGCGTACSLGCGGD